MRRRIWLVLAIAALVAASFVASSIAAKRSSERRDKYITRGLDYLHSRQTDTGGFASPANTAWAVLGAVANGERMGSSAWTVKGKNAFDYLQNSDIVAAVSAEGGNAPTSYAQLIMAYIAMGKGGSIGTAGTKGVNLLTLMLGYQDVVDGSTTKGAIAPSLPSTDGAAETTSWALLAMCSAKVSPSDPRFGQAETWLAGQQNAGDGGFPSSAQGAGSDAFATALAVQALKVSSGGLDWNAVAARTFLAASQNANGGFPVGGTNAETTSAAIQAIVALAEKPDDWTTTSGGTPVTALHRLLQTNGSYRLASGSKAGPLRATSWAITALAGHSFTTFPLTIPRAVRAFKFRPQLRFVTPKNGTQFKSTRTVHIKASYTDFYPKGTGIDVKTSRVYVDNANRTRPARMGKYSMSLELKGVKDGDHTYTIKLVDHAGNQKIIERKFTVAVPTPTPTPTTQPTYIPNPVYPTNTPTPSHTTTTPTPYVTPTPYQSVTPYPYNSVSPYPSTSGTPVIGSPVPSPSTSASPGAKGGGGGSAAGFVGGTLLAMLPIGAAISFLALQRREALLDGASQGTQLSGGGSAWERFKNMLAKSKDLTRPSSRK